MYFPQYVDVDVIVEQVTRIFDKNISKCSDSVEANKFIELKENILDIIKNCEKRISLR